MTSPWTIAPAAPRVDLADGRGTATFTVTNQGPVDQRLVVDVVPGDGTDRGWYTVTEPQRLVAHGTPASFTVGLTVPPGTTAGPRWFAARAYSADTAPEETSVVSDRVAFDVPVAAVAVPWWRRYWWVFAVAGLLVVALVVVLVVVLGSSDEPPPVITTSTVTSTPAVPTAVRRAGALSFNQDATLDLDELVLSGPQAEADLLYQPLLPGDGFMRPLNGARIARIPATAEPARDCFAAALAAERVQVSAWKLGEVLCVRTGADRLSFIVLNQKLSRLIAPPPPPMLQVSITTFESGGES